MKVGVSKEEAYIVADLLARSDLRGVETHGVTRLPIYIKRLQKGYGLTVAHEMLTAVLTGGKWTRNIKSLYEEDKTGIQGTCHSFMALDPECFIGREPFKENMDRYIKSIKESGKAKNIEEILMPGEPEFRTESEGLKEGIPLASNTVGELTSLAQSLGISIGFI